VRVDSAGGPPPDQVWVFPLGQALSQDAIALGRADRPVWTSAPRDMPTLDGHVLALWGERLVVTTFSQGGNPGSVNPNAPSPTNAGSSDGNALLFFHDPARAQAYASDPAAYPGINPFADYSAVKVVTTIVHGAPGQLPNGAQAHSYAFSLASNAPLPTELSPTLTIYYRVPLMRNDGDLLIYRREEGGTWTPLPTYHPPGAPFVAAPLDARTQSARFPLEPAL
jgi:hypothetical protein